MRLEIVRTVFLKELREMLRDRRSLAVMFGLPLVLYPLLAIGISSMGLSRQRELTEQKARVVVAPDVATAAPRLLQLLNETGSEIQVVTPAGDAAQALAEGGVDAILEVPPDAERRALAGDAEVEITYRLDRSRSSAPFVEEKIEKVLESYQKWLVEQRLARVLPPAVSPETVLRPLKTESIDVASGKQVFGKILAQALPLLLMLTGMMGALFPALNATTTERELGTLETLLVTPAGRTELLVAKGALVLVCALLTAGLNMLSMSLVLLKTVAPVMTEETALELSPAALVLTYLAAVPTLIFFTAVVVIVGMLARNFREANSYATPAMLVPLASLAVGILEPEATPGLLITPVANTTLIIREVLTGRVGFGAFFLAFASSCLYAGLMLSVAARLFSSEQLVNPAWEPVSFKGLRRGKAGRAARPRRVPPVDAALALFAVCLLLLFYLSPTDPERGLLYIAAFNQLAIILAPTLLFALVGRWDFVATFRWRGAGATVLIAAALLGVGLAPVVQLVSQFQQTFWPQNPDKARMIAELIVPALQAHPVLVPLVIGVLAGFCEEMLFRGALQTPMQRRMPGWAAVIIAAALFGAFHFDLNGLPIRAGLGVLLGWLAWRSNSIFPAMITHGVYDATVLGLAAWQIRASGPESVMPPADGAMRLSPVDVIALAIGVVMVTVAIVMLRRAFDRASPTSPARGFEVAITQPAKAE